MKKTEYIAPGYTLASFSCVMRPHISAHSWLHSFSTGDSSFQVRRCQESSCGAISIWKGKQGAAHERRNGMALSHGSALLIYPTNMAGPDPNDDLSDEVKSDFNEARTIAMMSPRGAAALLRLALQKLMKQLGKTGKDLNADIASLVSDGLPPQIQQALDIVRVVGNESVHPGEMHIDDDVETVETLFELINLIVQDRITFPKETAEMYNRLPERKRTEIEKRDQVVKDVQ